MATAGRRFLIALDFDGVLVDSAQETALSGFHAAKALWPGAGWLTRRLRRPDQMAALVQNFEAIRPCLETGWESTILLHLLAECAPDPGSAHTHPPLSHRGWALGAGDGATRTSWRASSTGCGTRRWPSSA